MRQVPYYLIIGNGRVARHFRHYLSLLNLPAAQWGRSESPALLSALLPRATHVLVLISDGAIEPFIAGHLREAAAVKVHFSGALATPLAFGAHPLMTFGAGLYTLDKYKAIPFVIDEGATPFARLLPGLPNPHVTIAPSLKEKYHALCVLGGNFSCLLWQKFLDALEKDFGFPPEIGHVYLRQQTENLIADHSSAFTGPLARGDRETIEKNLRALEGDPFRDIYQSFVKLREKQP